MGGAFETRPNSLLFFVLFYSLSSAVDTPGGFTVTENYAQATEIEQDRHFAAILISFLLPPVNPSLIFPDSLTSRAGPLLLWNCPYLLSLDPRPHHHTAAACMHVF